MNEGLGFREMKKFNVAILGKMTWKLITNPDTICSHLFKGIYHPYLNLLNAKQGRKASWIWASLMIGRTAINKGYRWI